MMNSPTLVTVIPCYNEQEVLQETNRKLSALYDQMIEADLISDRSKILYVNDGSSDRTWNTILDLFSISKYVDGIKLAINAGHQNALLAGLCFAKEFGDIFISIDADLQDDINVIPQMVEKYREGYDIVYGVRKERSTDTFFKRTTAIGFYKLMNFLGVRMVYNHADFRLMSQRAVEELGKYRERNLFLRGIVPLIGYRNTCVFYNRGERLAGESKYPFSKMLNFAIDGITSFSVKPVRFVFSIGLVFLFISIIILFYVFYSIITNNYVAGWASIMLSIWFVGGIVLIGLGIVGEYIGKIYIEVKGRPRYNIEEIKKK